MLKKKFFIVFFLFVLFSLYSLDSYNSSSLALSLKLNNADLIKAQEEITKAKLDVLDAKAGFFPTVDLTVTGTYIANPIDPIRVNIGDYINIPGYNDYINIYNGMEKTYYMFQLELTQPIFTWGKLDKALKLYNQIYDIRVLEYTDAYEKSLTELKTRVMALYFLNQIHDILNEQKNISKRLNELSDSAYENGFILKTEALNTHVQSTQVDVAYEQINKEVLSMQSYLSKLTGIDDFSIDMLSDDISNELADEKLNKLVSDYSKLSLKTYVDKSVSDERTNLKLLYALTNISEYSKNIAEAQVNWKPDIALVVNASYSGPRLPFIETDWYGKNDWNALFTIALKTTVFDGGKAIRNVKRSKSDLYESRINTLDSKAVIINNVTENYTSMNLSIANISYLNAEVELKNEEINMNKSLLDSGYGGEIEYLRTILDRNTLLIQLLQEKINLYKSIYTLQYLIGDSHIF